MESLERLTRIEKKRDALLERVATLDPERAALRPGPDTWSIREIVEHLVIAEEAVVDDRPASAPRRRGLRDRLLYRVVMFILRFDIPVRAPSRRMIPSGALEIEALAARWRANHDELRRRLKTSSAENPSAPRFRHPVSGPMDVDRALRMLEVHLDRHSRQIEERWPT